MLRASGEILQAHKSWLRNRSKASLVSHVKSASTMKLELHQFSLLYVGALRKHLKQRLGGSVPAAQVLGRQAMGLGLGTLALAKIHEQALISLVLPSSSARTRAAMVRRAGAFFANTITP